MYISAGMGFIFILVEAAVFADGMGTNITNVFLVANIV